MARGRSDNPMFECILFASWLAGIISILVLKSLMRKYCPETHNYVFGATLADFSARTSFRSMKFIIFKSNWGEIRVFRVLQFLKITRVLMILFFVLFFGRIFYVIFLNAVFGA